VSSTSAVPPKSRAARFFFMHLGSLVAYVVYLVAAGPPPASPDAVRRALVAALLTKTGYMLVAWQQGELKHFDRALWLLFAIGAAGAWLGVDAVIMLFQQYTGALFFTTLGLAAVVPLALGREPFTEYYGRRQIPAWQQRTNEYGVANRVLTTFWSIVFFTAAALCAWRPDDLRYTVLYPNLLVFLVGLPSALWVPPLWFRFFPQPLPDRVEPILMGMPMFLDRRATKDVDATIQFRVRGAEAGAYHLRIARGRCESFEGPADRADVTVDTPDTVWLRISRGELDGTKALMEGLYTAEGDVMLLAKLPEWFPVRR
jgi:hypothetical protein